MDGGFTQHWLTPSHSSHTPEPFEVERHGRLTMATWNMQKSFLASPPISEMRGSKKRLRKKHLDR